MSEQRSSSVYCALPVHDNMFQCVLKTEKNPTKILKIDRNWKSSRLRGGKSDDDDDDDVSSVAVFTHGLTRDDRLQQTKGFPVN